MKCTAKVEYKVARRKGSGEKYNKIVRYVWDNFPEYKDSDLSICGGKIIATVKAVDEAEWGDHFAVLRVDYICETCCGLFYSGLPTALNISEWVTDVIEKM